MNKIDEFEIMPPSLPGDVWVVEFMYLPSIVHRISAGGFDGAVPQLYRTLSPLRASNGPFIVTCAGGTVNLNF